MQANHTKSIPALFGEAIEQLGRHFGSEVQLAKAEMSERIARAEKGAAFVAIAAVLMIPALVMLLLTLALWLTEMGMSPVVAHLLAAVGGAAVSIVLAAAGFNRLSAKNLKLTKTMDQIDRDIVAARNLAR
jgi:hypothetical protein